MSVSATGCAISIQTLDVDQNGGRLRSVTPDKEGIYRNFPLAILGSSSRNGIVYEENSSKAAMTNPKTRFGTNVAEGNQEGEFQHPDASLPVARLMRVDRPMASHYFCGIRFEKVENYTVVFGDFGITGPYGQYLREMLEDPNRNVAFSLRALTSPIKGKPKNIRGIKVMVTFDNVGGPGFAHASKRYIKDDIQKNVSVEELMTEENKDSLFCTESITDQQILDIFETNIVRVCDRAVGIWDEKSGTFIDPSKGPYRKKSAFAEMLKEM